MTTSIAQFEIYGYTDFFKSGNFFRSTDAEWNLPEKIRKDGKTYLYLSNPGCWVEENERSLIVNSHCPTLSGFDPSKKIWKIYDAIEVEILIELLAISFLKESPFFKDFPANYIHLEKPGLIKTLKLGGYPSLYHNSFVRITPEILPDYCYTLNQLIASSRYYPYEL